MTDIDGRAVLATPMRDNDANADTIGAYLAALALEVWVQNEGFSGKRPFGNSGWSGDIEIALIDAGMVEGHLDEDGYLGDVDDQAVDQHVLAAVRALQELAGNCPRCGASADTCRAGTFEDVGFGPVCCENCPHRKAT